MSPVIRLIPIVFVVYKTKKGWRGFCHPYDVTCNAETLEDARKRLEKLVKLYEGGLKKYKNPRHLFFKKFSNQEDKKFFDNVVWPKISQDIQRRRLKSYMDYVSQQMEEERRKISIKEVDAKPVISYSHRPLAFQNN